LEEDTFELNCLILETCLSLLKTIGVDVDVSSDGRDEILFLVVSGF
jgi:hypothetical protein